MQFKINRQQLNQLLANNLKAISPQNVIDVLDDFLIKVDEQSLTITSSNTDLTIVQTVGVTDQDQPITVKSKGAAVLPARLLANAIKKMTGDQVTIKVDDGQAKITSGHAKFKLPALASDQYPHSPDFSEKGQMTLTADQFKTIIKRTSFATSKEDTRPILHGIHFKFNDDGQAIVEATDAHRLSTCLIQPASVDDEFKAHDYSLPAAGMTKLESLINQVDGDDSIVIESAKTHLRLRFGYYTIYLRLLTGFYPGTKGLVPDQFNTTLSIDRHDLQGIIDRADLAAGKINNNYATLTIKNQKATLTTTQSLDGLSTDEELTSADITGDDLELAFNVQYIKEALRAFDSENVVLKFVSRLRPFTITDPDDQEQRFVHLVTPVRTF